MPANRIIAVGLLTQSDLDQLGNQFTRAWPVNETPCFNGLLQAIDDADRELWRERNGSGKAPENTPERIIIHQTIGR